MRLKLIIIGIVTGLLTGCGSSSDNNHTPTHNDTIDENTTNQPDISNIENSQPDENNIKDNQPTAKNNALKDVSASFNGVTIIVTTDTIIDTVSTNTIAIYGKVKGYSTDALLKLNANYPKGTKFVVKVYENDKLIGSSKELTYNESIIHFNDIN